MSANDNRDFIDKIFDVFEPYKKTGIRFFAITICFILCFILGLFISPKLIEISENLLPFPITLYQLSPVEVLFNYLKIALFVAVFITLPLFVYQFGKLKVEKINFDSRLNLLLTSLILSTIIIVAFFLTIKFVFPFEIIFLYGLNTNIATISSSLSSMVSSFIVTMILLVIILLLPFMRKIIKKSLFFNYATLIKYKSTVILYSAILAGIIVLPLEIITLLLVFLIFFSWYKILVNFAKKSD